jgi:hypothetical protein
MGSALCFPVLALTTWAILAAGAPDANARKSIYVYGDDVIVPTAQAANAIKQLEAFGLKVNRDKSCISGFFRESCGMDAYKGVSVTPVRFRTVWSSSRCPESYTAWLAYANQLFLRKRFNTYNLIVEELCKIYKEIPDLSLFNERLVLNENCIDASMDIPCPCLIETPEEYRPKRKRANKALQKTEFRVLDVRTRPIKQYMTGWRMLLRYFAEACSSGSALRSNDNPRRSGVGSLTIREDRAPFSVSSYTKRKSSSLVFRWR